MSTATPARTRAALGDVPGHRVAELSIGEVCVQELLVRPAALPGFPVGVQGAPDEEPPAGDGVDAEQVPVGQGPARLAGLDLVVVAGAHDQVTAARLSAVGDDHRLGIVDQAAVEQGFADAAGQLPAQGMVSRDQQRVRAAGGQCRVIGCGCLRHQLRVAASDTAVLVVLLDHSGIAVAEP